MYSRFGNSRWYTYWYSDHSKGIKFPTNRLKRKQYFKIHDEVSYLLSYGELQDKGMGQIWDEIRYFYWVDYEGIKAKKPSEGEMSELMNYILEWEKDVNEYFKLKNFIKHEWYYPIKNKINLLWKRLLRK